MKNDFCLVQLLTLLLALGMSAHAEQHSATRLDDPATRFAPALYTPDDLRERFQDPELHDDFIEVLHQWGWRGKLDDFFNAGLTNEIIEMEIPVGSTLPFIAARADGQPICLRNVTWAGTASLSAYAFTFTSNGHAYRGIIPKPGSNFFVMDLGSQPQPMLVIDCSLPEKAKADHPFEACISVHNVGNITESNVSVSLPIPESAVVTATTDGGTVMDNAVQWTITNLPVNATKQICALLKPRWAGQLSLNPNASSADVALVQSFCDLSVSGTPALLLEKGGSPNPVRLGSTTTYTVRVTNQGTAEAGNVQVIATIAPELIPISASEGSINGQIVTFSVAPKLAAKKSVTYTIVARGVKAGDGRSRFDLTSEVAKSPTYVEESTTVD
ncbi:MAG TPA: hypothetical protein VGO57_11465 [Verrucomicrobiae bacterium]|jgi:uncharacterized repeat protein (TIGR01451 family)